jgi:hypothetical protein
MKTGRTVLYRDTKLKLTRYEVLARTISFIDKIIGREAVLLLFNISVTNVLE